MTQFERIKNMTIEEMAEFFAVDKYPNFPSSACYVCEYHGGWCCTNSAECTPEYETQVYKKWLESEFVKRPKDGHTIEVCISDENI